MGDNFDESSGVVKRLTGEFRKSLFGGEEYGAFAEELLVLGNLITGKSFSDLNLLYSRIAKEIDRRGTRGIDTAEQVSYLVIAASIADENPNQIIDRYERVSQENCSTGRGSCYNTLSSILAENE